MMYSVAKGADLIIANGAIVSNAISMNGSLGDANAIAIMAKTGNAAPTAVYKLEGAYTDVFDDLKSGFVTVWFTLNQAGVDLALPAASIANIYGPLPVKSLRINSKGAGVVGIQTFFVTKQYLSGR